jgi:hypothetical protein
MYGDWRFLRSYQVSSLVGNSEGADISLFLMNCFAVVLFSITLHIHSVLLCHTYTCTVKPCYPKSKL